MSSIERMGAMESMFDPEQTTATLLEAVKTNVANTVKTVDAAASLENKLSEEAAQFNACLTTMANAIHKCERGEISREEMLAECAPCVAVLKEKCSALKLADVKTTGDDITEDEIAMLREYIVGCKDIVANHKRALQDCPTECANEGLLAGLAEYEPATESKMGYEVRKSTEAKTANELYKQAKKLYGLGSKEKALEHLKKAQNLYEKCLEKAEEAGKMYVSNRTIKTATIGMSVKDNFEKKVTDSISDAQVIQYFEDRIDSCKALELQWNNKAGKSTFKETKAQLKAERKQARADRRAARKAAKEEVVEAFGMTYEEFEASLESLMDTLELDLALEAALEAEGEETVAGAATVGAKLRAAFAKLKKAKKEDDKKAIEEARKEVNEAADELAEGEKNAETPEEKKKWSKAAKIGLASAATAAVVVAGTTALAIRAKKMADSGAEVKGANAILAKMADTVAKGAVDTKNGAQQFVQHAGDAAASRRIGKEEQRQAKLDADKERADRFLIDTIEKQRQKGIDAINKAGAAYEKKKAKGKLGNGSESFLSSLAFGLEGVMIEDEDVDDDRVEPMEGKAFDEDFDEAVTEAAIDVMLAEDGIDDSDLM